MAESSIKKMGDINEDRISDLPLHIQEIILCFLPIHDAAKTSVLSRKWRHCWNGIPNLIFDSEFSISCKLDRYRYRSEELQAIKYVGVINKVLLLHNGPIFKFSLHWPMDCDPQVIHEFIDHWIPLFSRNGTKQLILEEFNEYGNFKAHNFSYLNLTHLRLTRAMFPYSPALGGFTNLIILELVSVTSDFGQSILDCPALEKLTLIFCNELFPINFRAPNLKCLHQVCYQVTLEYDIVRLENLPEYSYVLVEDPGTQTESSNAVKVLGSFQKIEKFATGMYFLKCLAAGGCPNRLSQPLPYLKTLNIWDMNFANLSEVSCLLCLIRSAPNLCKLHISHDFCYHDEDCECDDEEDRENYWIDDSEDCTIDHLEIVTFSNLIGSKAEMELIKFLLGHSPLLRTMSIHRGAGIEKDVALTMAEEIMQYSRASSRVQIKDLEDPVIIDDFDLELWRQFFM